MYMSMIWLLEEISLFRKLCYGFGRSLSLEPGIKSISISWSKIESRAQSKIHQDLHVKVCSRNGARCCSQTCER